MNEEQTIFAEALAKPTREERAAYLDSACKGQVDLRNRVQELLQAHEQAGGFLESSPYAGQTKTTASTIREHAGAMIGPYKLLEQIGEGGMGVVFIAEQTHPLKRRVALKIVKPGLDTRQVIARFEAERQALAMMDHPNIAKVLDAGTTETGRPYFVMELVKGIPITQYCDEHQLTAEQRLELFVQVCQAVQHAHQKGIIHRDIKPSNVLVTLADEGRATPKVIDFGVAKATGGQRLTDRTLYTELRQFVGTPLYMSPEQAEMSALMDADTRSDVYSLGVLLYELLTGTTPFEKERLAQAAYDEVRRIIREEEPPRPSARISTLGQTLTSISSKRQTDPKRLEQTIRGELDWIVMKAMEKDRGRRYETANAFARDVQRYLSDQAVEACPPSRIYRFRKFVRRNKPVLTVATIIFVVLLAATLVSVLEARQARAAQRQAKAERDQALVEKQRANEQARIAQAVQDFLNDDLLRQSDIFEQGSNVHRDLKVREALDRAAAQIGDRFKDQPLVEAAIRSAIGDAYLGLNLEAEAQKHLTAAWEIRQRTLGPQAPETLQSLCDLAYCYAATGHGEQAKQTLLPILQRQEKEFGEHDESLLPTLQSLTAVYLMSGEYANAEATSRRHMAIAIETHQSTSTINVDKRYLASALTRMGRPKEAEPLLIELLEERQKAWGEKHLQTASMESELAVNYRAQKKYDQALAMQQQALETYRRVLGDDDDRTVGEIYGLGWIYLNANQREEAWRYLDEALERQRKKYGDASAIWLNDVADIRLNDEQYVQAEETYRRVLKGWRLPLGDDNPQIVRAMANLGVALQKQGKSVEADRWLRQALTLARNQSDVSSSKITIGVVAHALKETQHWAEAEECYLRLLKIVQSYRGLEHPDVAESYADLGQIAYQLHHYTEAEQRCRAAMAIHDKLDALGWKGASAQTTLGEIFIDQGKLDEAEQTLSAAYANLRPGPGGAIEPMKKRAIEQAFVRLYERWHKPEKMAAWQQKLTATTAPSNAAVATTRDANHPKTLVELENLADAYKRQRRYDKAEPLYRQALDQQRKTYGVLHPMTIALSGDLAVVYFQMHRYADAERAFQEQIELMRKTPDHKELDVAMCLYNYANLEKAIGKPNDAADLYRQTVELRRKSLGDHDDVVTTLVTLSTVLRSEEKYADAEVAMRDALEMRQRLLPKGHWLIANLKRVLGSLLTHEGKYAEAETLLLAANAEFAAQNPPPDQTARITDAIRQTAELYEKWGKPDQAAIWRANLAEFSKRPTSRTTTQPAAVTQ